MTSIYAIVVHDTENRGFEKVATDAARALELIGLNPLYQSNEYPVTDAMVADPDFSTEVSYHGQDMEPLSAFDETQSPVEVGCGEHADGLVGIHWPTKADNTDPPEGWSWVERCDACELFEDDEAAARALIVKLGVPATGVAWFDRYSHEPVPGNQYVMGASVAIKIPEPEEGTS